MASVHDGTGGGSGGAAVVGGQAEGGLTQPLLSGGVLNEERSADVREEQSGVDLDC